MMKLSLSTLLTLVVLVQLSLLSAVHGLWDGYAFHEVPEDFKAEPYSAKQYDAAMKVCADRSLEILILRTAQDSASLANMMRTLNIVSNVVLALRVVEKDGTRNCWTPTYANCAEELEDTSFLPPETTASTNKFVFFLPNGTWSYAQSSPGRTTYVACYNRTGSTTAAPTLSPNSSSDSSSLSADSASGSSSSSSSDAAPTSPATSTTTTTTPTQDPADGAAENTENGSKEESKSNVVLIVAIVVPVAAVVVIAVVAVVVYCCCCRGSSSKRAQDEENEGVVTSALLPREKPMTTETPQTSDINPLRAKQVEKLPSPTPNKTAEPSIVGEDGIVRPLQAHQSILSHRSAGLSPNQSVRLHELRHRATSDASFGQFLDDNDDDLFQEDLK